MTNFIIPQANVPAGLSLKQQAQKARVPRRPVHNFHVKHHPYTIQPFMIAPVLPGETLKSLNLQSRCVSDPLTSRLVGWWLEHYLFYIPLTALDFEGNDQPREEGTKASLTAMLMDIGSPLTGAGKLINEPGIYVASDGYDYVSRCLERVTDAYFRQEGESALGITFADGYTPTMPIASLRNRDVTQSLFLASELPTETVDVDDTTDTFDVAEMDEKYKTWLILTSQGLTHKSYEDYLADFGVRQPSIRKSRIELIRVSNEWSYPTNTVEPSTGVPSTAMSWSIQVRADKDRFFREPGFIFGVTVARPKTYRKDQEGSIAAHMIGALDWMPAVYKDRVEFSLKTFSATQGPFKTLYTEPYILDMRDLFTHGDQYVGDTVSTVTRANTVAVVADADNSEQRYPTFASIEAMFSGSTDATRLVTQDGVVQLDILGTQVDHTT